MSVALILFSRTWLPAGVELAKMVFAACWHTTTDRHPLMQDIRDVVAITDGIEGEAEHPLTSQHPV